MKELIIIYLLIGIILRVVNLVGYIIYYGRTPYSIIRSARELVLYACGAAVGTILWPYSVYLTYKGVANLKENIYSGDLEDDLVNFVDAIIKESEEES